ncbi:unnamed protein product [Cuscuta campestris]|uniref:Uncharacterized protein n=1 Tax=Cuscuta campestris TaxID=132261 RepID=A0A484LWZ4_9ASTE|nr:unnamed protein product [Cuscuta campestris]
MEKTLEFRSKKDDLKHNISLDAVSRKISLDALVDFALAQGSQWIFITPHDISMVKQDERVRKQQMTAPR